MSMITNLKRYKKECVQTVVLVLCVSTSFGLGRITVLYDKKPVTIENNAEIAKAVLKQPDPSPTSSAPAIPAQAKFVASNSGKKYYPLGCLYASRISDAKKIYFISEEEATSQGFEKSTVCDK